MQIVTQCVRIFSEKHGKAAASASENRLNAKLYTVRKLQKEVAYYVRTENIKVKDTLSLIIAMPAQTNQG